MAKNIDFMGAVFPDVPSIRLPQYGGGLVSFDDTTDADATAADIALNKTAYVNGVKLVGTSQAIVPTGSQTVTQNGTYDVTALAQMIVTVAGGGGSGLVYESGTYTPTSDIAQPTISFSNTHSNMPFCVIIQDIADGLATANSALEWGILNWYSFTGRGFNSTSATAYSYARAEYIYKTTNGVSNSGNSISSFSTTATTGLGYYLSNTSFKPYLGSTSRYWRSGRTYKWIAVWSPS